MRKPHHVVEEGFLRVLGVILLEAAPHGGNPAGGIDGCAVRAIHFFDEDGLGALFRRFKRGAHAGKAGADNDNVPVFREALLFRGGRLSGARCSCGGTNEAGADEISSLHEHSPFWGSEETFRQALFLIVLCRNLISF